MTDKRKEYCRRYRKENKEKIKEYNRKYREQNKEKVLLYFKEYNKKWYIEHKKERTEYNKKYKEDNKDRIAKTNKEYYKNNKDKLIYNALNRRRCNTDIKLKHLIATKIGKWLKGNKDLHTLDYIPFNDISELKTHLESQFDDIMNWDNHGTYWHIDHIIPQSLYDFSDLTEIKKCWDLRNLRPLEAMENISKNKTINCDLVHEYNIRDLLPKNFSYKEVI